VTARPEVDARLLYARVPAVLRVVGAERAEAHVELGQREEEAGMIDLLGILRRRRAVTDLEPALDLRLELDGLRLGRPRRAEEQRGDLAIERVLLEEERELAALVDLDPRSRACRC